MTDYKKIKKYPATKNGRQVRAGDSIPISSLTEKTDTINNSEFFALDDTNLNQSLKLNLAEHSKQIGEANKVIDSSDIIVSEEIDNDLGKTQKLSIKKTNPSVRIEWATSQQNLEIDLDITRGFSEVIIYFLSGSFQFTEYNLLLPAVATIKYTICYDEVTDTATTNPIRKLNIYNVDIESSRLLGSAYLLLNNTAVNIENEKIYYNNFYNNYYTKQIVVSCRPYGSNYNGIGAYFIIEKGTLGFTYQIIGGASGYKEGYKLFNHSVSTSSGDVACKQKYKVIFVFPSGDIIKSNAVSSNTTGFTIKINSTTGNLCFTSVSSTQKENNIYTRYERIGSNAPSYKIYKTVSGKISYTGLETTNNQLFIEPSGSVGAVLFTAFVADGEGF